VNEADFDREQQGWSAEDVWKAIQTQLPLEPDLVVTHDDFSLDNVLIEDSGITGCIDVGGTGLADRYHDLAICWSDLPNMERTLKSDFSDATVSARATSVSSRHISF
jgi:aminoglycoside 3'-phosphotransferase-1